MELEEKIASYFKHFSEEFPAFKDVAFLYLLTSLLHFSPRKHHIVDWSFSFLINTTIVSRIIEAHWFDLKYFTNAEIREASEILMSNCIEDAIRISRLNLNYLDVIYKLHNNEPEAISLNSEKPISNKSFDELLTDLKAGNLHSFITSSDDLKYTVDHKKLSEKGFSDLAKLTISSSIDDILRDLKTPKELYRILVSFCEPQQKSKIEIPYAGIGSILIELKKAYPNHNLVTFCNTENSFAELLFQANLVANDCNTNLIISSDFLEDAEDYHYENSVDIAISVLPFKKQIDNRNLSSNFFKDSFNIANSQYASVELMLSTVNNNGKVIVAISDSFLFSKQGVKFRKNLLTNDWVESVISLPKDILRPYSSIKSSIIVLNKAKYQKGFVIFDGSEDKFEKTKVSIEEIFSNDLDLRASRYALKESQELKSILSKYPQNEVKKINDLIDSSISGHNYSPKNRIVENSAETLPYVRVADLARNEIEFDLDVSKIGREISAEKARKRTIIDFSAVLISKIAPKLKPTYFNFTGQPIVIGSDVVALKVKEDVNVEYFLTQLYSQLVKIQVEMMSSGNMINRISIQDFLNIQIILPPLEEQQREILEMRGVLEEKAIAQEEIALAKKEIETTEYDVIAAITHNLNQKLGQIVDDYGTLMLFLQNKEKNQMPIRFDEILRPMRNGESVDNIPTFSKVANRLQNNLLDTAYTMKTTENILQKSVVKTEELDIIRFFKKSVKADFENSQFTLKVETKLKSLIVLADINALKDAFRNLIENAKKHGFTQSDQKYQIIFEISKYTDNSGDNFARIVYKNNGNPFPKSYRFEDYTRLGTRMGKNKGTGIGGFFVKKVIDLHKGSFKEITLHENNQEIFQVQMEILLPLAD
ncbi:MAG TPA: N-6 DNA methylase [Pyrinomonadaceae bacterium]|nr:N-6 DNA methylase [Pyrinomonadaceae bacterium]